MDFPVLHVFLGALVDILVLKIQVCWLGGGSLHGVLSRNPLYFCSWCPEMAEVSLILLSP